MYAKVHTTKLIIVVIPYTALLADTMMYCQQQKISTIEWKRGVTSQHNIVLVPVELAVTDDSFQQERTRVVKILSVWIIPADE